ncbi:nucleotidyltransferase family protein [Roseomonas sp. OT10]|uniref:nucleotidyltransferase family protein n=1 Tax=Roseomonas cutis TaxID=2897332 RepID=UPI001E577413|nr:nucleotidyltransferase family protein [Roseomonas sp. OT10]UFN47537.1 nucleotidyltransferase family protein [Roseomonas sp. OT10]
MNGAVPAAPGPAQAERLLSLLRRDAALLRLLGVLRGLDLPDWLLVSGCLYQSAWNALTGRPADYGLRDYDLAYFDPDTSWEAEDRVIRRVAAATAGLGLPAPVEARNQARIHLWFEGHFGHCYGSPLRDTAQALTRYAATAHAVGVRWEADGAWRVVAPFGLEDLFAMVLRPNPALDNAASHAAKAARAKAFWPEVTVLPWPGA